MVDLTYTEDREAFERQLFHTPPHAARMAEHAGRFVEWLGNSDKDALLLAAFDRFWETREHIHQTQDILKVWIGALKFAARRRPRWQVWCGYTFNSRWVKGSQLGKR